MVSNYCARSGTETQQEATKALAFRERQSETVSVCQVGATGEMNLSEWQTGLAGARVRSGGMSGDYLPSHPARAARADPFFRQKCFDRSPRAVVPFTSSPSSGGNLE